MCRRSGPAKQGRVRGVRRGQPVTGGRYDTGEAVEAKCRPLHEGWGWEAVLRPLQAVAKRRASTGARGQEVVREVVEDAKLRGEALPTGGTDGMASVAEADAGYSGTPVGGGVWSPSLNGVSDVDVEFKHCQGQAVAG